MERNRSSKSGGPSSWLTHVCCVRKISDDSPEADLPASMNEEFDGTTPDGKKKAAALKRHAVAVPNFTMAFTTEGLMALVYGEASDEWPAGQAHLIVVALFGRYRPEDTMTRDELRKHLHKVSMEKTEEDPSTLFDRLSAIKIQYDTRTRKVDEGDLMAVVIDAAPATYQAVLTTEQLRLGDTITLNDLSAAMRAHWRGIGGTKSKGGLNDELVLSTFSGFCFECKKPDHKAHECPLKEKGDSSGGGDEKKLVQPLWNFRAQEIRLLEAGREQRQEAGVAEDERSGCGCGCW
jgi:hypothetical protein